MAVDRDRQVGVWRCVVIDQFALGCAEDHVDHIGLAVLDHALRFRPLGGDQFDLDAGFFLPQLPEIGDITFRFAIGIAKKIRRVIVVGDHAQNLWLCTGTGCQTETACQCH